MTTSSDIAAVVEKRRLQKDPRRPEAIVKWNPDEMAHLLADSSMDLQLIALSFAVLGFNTRSVWAIWAGLYTALFHLAHGPKTHWLSRVQIFVTLGLYVTYFTDLGKPMTAPVQ